MKGQTIITLSIMLGLCCFVYSFKTPDIRYSELGKIGAFIAFLITTKILQDAGHMQRK